MMNFGANLPLWQSILFYLIFVWSLVWKGVALWKAAKSEQRNWFVVMLVLNTFGILEIIYLFRFTKKKMKLKDIKDGMAKIFYTKPKS